LKEFLKNLQELYQAKYHFLLVLKSFHYGA
jgi:hypothetical protein